MKESEADRTLPLVSVIMPTYNHAEFIKDSIESVLNQSYKHLELIIIDNFSADDTERIVDSFINADRRIRYFKFSNHGIIAASRNFGIANSKGEYIAFLDSDDMWHCSKLENQLKHFTNDELVGVGSDAMLVSYTPYYRPVHWGRSKDGYVDYGYHSILNANPIMTSSVVVRKDALLAVGGFDENPDFRFIEDWELWLRMARLGRFRVLGKQFLVYRVFSEKSRDRVDVSKRLFKVLEKHLELGYIANQDSREPRARINLSIANRSLELGDPACRQYYFRALQGSSALKMKASIGYFLSLLPRVLRQAVRFILYKTDKAVYCGLDLLWRIRSR
jgi:glycosyltransferase involved in cell wall biosynthesis